MATKKYVSLEKLTQYDELLKNKIAADDAAALESAKSYADGLAVNYDAAGSATTAEANAKAYTDTEVAKANEAAATAQAAAEAAAAAAGVADGKAAAAQGEVDALETYVGTIPEGATATNVVAYIQEKTAGIATEGAMTELGNRVTAVEGDVATIKGDYLKATDKTELEGKINVKADQSALDEVAATANAAATNSALEAEVKTRGEEITRVEGLVSAEAERAAGIEAGLEDRIETMEAFWTAAKADGTDSNVIDTLKEIQDYIASDESGASEMLAAIEANEKAIEDMDAAYKAADATLQGNIDKKADTSVVEAIDGRVGALETASATHATKDEVKAVSDALSAYDDAHKGDYTNAQIDAAIKVNTDAIAKLNDTYATDEELAAAIEGAKTDASNKDAAILEAAQNASNAVQANLDEHTGNGDIHVTTTDKTKWNAALQAADITTGAENGTISVKGADIAVKGLGSAAYVATTTFDAAGSASTAEANAKKYTDEAVAKFVEVSEEEINALFA